MSKQKFYRLENLNDSVDADYRILLGERSNGKSYAVKERAIRNAWNDEKGNSKFMIVRRWGMELKSSSIEQYFVDAPITAITNNECNTVKCIGGKIFLAYYDNETRKTTCVRHVGYYRDLCGEQHFVSQNFDDVIMIIFEEFISRDYYLPQETIKFMNFVSTVARRRRIPVYMIGNTISRVCPYFVDWELTRVPKQKQGTIDLYEIHTGEFDDETHEEIIVRISVEYCENSGKNSKMFFGKSSSMITSGTWQVKEHAQLDGHLNDYCVMHKIIFIHTGFKFQMFFVQPKTGGLPLWYVRPFTDNVKDQKLRSERFVVHTFKESIGLPSDMVTIGFKPLTPEENETFKYLDRLTFSDNLTGTDFDTCYQSINR